MPSVQFFEGLRTESLSSPVAGVMNIKIDCMKEGRKIQWVCFCIPYAVVERGYVWVEKRKRWIATFLDKAEGELKEGQKKEVWWESCCPCAWGGSGASQDCSYSVMFRIMSWNIDLLVMHNSSTRSMFSVHMRGVWEGLYLCRCSPKIPVKQELMCRDSVASLDGPLTSAGPFGDVVERLWFFRLSETGLLVHEKQNGNWWGP